MDKKRLDILMVDMKIADSREKAKKYIKSGCVYVENIKITKPGIKIESNANIQLKGDPLPYVSRGGLKLEGALEEFNLDITNKVALDIGASTGGFSDFMLQNGVKKIYAIDVGKDQLAAKIKNNPKVISMEKTNVRYMKKGDIKEEANFVSIDVSFISLRYILPVIKDLTSNDVDIVALIKPQFEAGKEKIGKKGIVKDKRVHFQVIADISKFSLEIGLYIQNLAYSPIKGGDGNIEYLAHLRKDKKEIDINKLINHIVDKAHNKL